MQTAPTPQRTMTPNEEEDDSYESIALRIPTKKEPLPLRDIKIGTWNVNNMNNRNKNYDVLDDVIKKMKDNGLKILGLCETKWMGNKVEVMNDVIVCSSGGKKKCNGVALLLTKDLGGREVKMNFVTDRILMVEIEAEPCNLVIFQVYFPTTAYSEGEIDDFYESLEVEMDTVNDDAYLVLMGDFNARVGKRQEGDGEEVGEFGCALRNDRGQKLVYFCKRKGLVITNTLFNQSENQRHTWVSPSNEVKEIQIDYIIVRKRCRRTVLDSRTYPGMKLKNNNMHIHIPVAMSIIIESEKNGSILSDVKSCRHIFLKYTTLCKQRLESTNIQNAVRNLDIETNLQTKRNDSLMKYIDSLEKEKCLFDVDVALSTLDRKQVREQTLDVFKGIENRDTDEELIRHLRIHGKGKFKKLCTEIYEEEEWPEEFTALISEPQTRERYSSNDNVIASKINLSFLKIMMERKAKERAKREQFAFRTGRGKRDAISALRILAEKFLESDEDLIVCFVNFRKIINRSTGANVVNVLERIGVEKTERKLLTSLYSSIYVNTEENSELLIKCFPIFSVLFSICIEETFPEKNKGVRLGNTVIRSIRYGDNIALVSRTKRDLEHILGDLNERTKEYGMTLCEKNTKVMVMARYTSRTPIKVEIEVGTGKPKLEQVSQIQYLGSILCQNCKYKEEIQASVELGKNAYEILKPIFDNSRDQEFRENFGEDLIWTVVLYAAETWSIAVDEERILERFHSWLTMRIKGLKRDGMISEENVHQTILEKQRKWLEDISTGNCVLDDLVYASLNVTNSKGCAPRQIFDGLLQSMQFETYVRSKYYKRNLTEAVRIKLQRKCPTSSKVQDQIIRAMIRAMDSSSWDKLVAKGTLTPSMDIDELRELIENGACDHLVDFRTLARSLTSSILNSLVKYTQYYEYIDSEVYLRDLIKAVDIKLQGCSPTKADISGNLAKCIKSKTWKTLTKDKTLHSGMDIIHLRTVNKAGKLRNLIDYDKYFTNQKSYNDLKSWVRDKNLWATFQPMVTGR